MTRYFEVPTSTRVQNWRFLNDLDWSLDNPEHVVVRFREKAHLTPWFIAGLGAWALEARDRGFTFEVENPESASWGWRMHLHEYLGIADPLGHGEHEPAGRFVPLTRVRNAGEAATLQTDLLPLFHTLNPAWLSALQYVLSEMLRNVREHAGAAHGAVACAQYWAGGERPYVQIGIADAGIGIQGSLAAAHGQMSHAEAVIKAIQPGISGTIATGYGGLQNAGMGLSVTGRLAAV